MSRTEKVSNSMKTWSMSGRRRGARSPSVTSPLVQRRRDVTVELNSQAPLPCYWEQCLDIRTGRVLYRNQRTGETTNIDPRLSNSSSDIDSSSNSGSNSSSSDEYVDRYFSNTDISSSLDDSSSSSSNSSGYYSEVILPEQQHQQVLILAGCRYCYVYLMVPKHEVFCPQCSQPLLDFTARNC